MRKITLLLISFVLASQLSVFSSEKIMKAKTESPVTITGANGITDGTGYTTLKAAFDAINAQADQSGKNIEIQISGNTAETATAVLNQPTTASWNSLTIYPTVAGVKISGDFASNLIDLNGADKVTITGRLNITGDSKSLTIENTKTGDNAARTLRLWNDAKLNTITHCIIKGSCPSSGAAVLFIGTGLSTGNDENTISYNDFNKSGTTSPYSSIYSAGTSAMTNDKNIIEYNNFFNLYSGGTFYAIRVGSNSSEFTIRNNNIYEPNEIIPTAANAFNGISITGTGEKFIISNNNIGGSGPGCIGLFKKSNAFSNDFTGIFVSTSTSATNSSSIQGNLIKNIEWKNTAVKKDFVGINSFGNMVNIGNTEANNISNITWENGAISGGVFYGFNIINSEGINLIQNNIISDITINNTDAAHGSNFYGFFKSNSAGTVTLKSNNINNVSVNGTSSSNSQIVAGIYCNYTSGTVRTFNFDISNNIISNITNASARTDVINSAYGIFLNPTQGSGNVLGNKIYNITASSVTSPARIIGINMDVTSTSTTTVCSNNMITLGNSNPGLVYGILQNTGLAKVDHNSVLIAGSPASGSFESSALNVTGTTTGREFLNNILINTRSNSETATSKHYTVKYNAPINLSSDYNVVNFTGTGGLLGAVGTTDYVTVQDWVTETTLDTHSLVAAVNFTDPTTGDLSLTGASVGDATLKVPSLAAVTTDFTGKTRNASFTYAGAYESTLPFTVTAVDNTISNNGVHITKSGVEVLVNGKSSIELYTINGVIIDKAVVSSTYSRALCTGAYIVKINGKAVKFIK